MRKSDGKSGALDRCRYVSTPLFDWLLSSPQGELLLTVRRINCKITSLSYKLIIYSRKFSGAMSCNENRLATSCKTRFFRDATEVSLLSSYNVHRFNAMRSVKKLVGSSRINDSINSNASFRRHVYKAQRDMLLIASLYKACAGERPLQVENRS